ncbi:MULTISPECIES: hypothetical protein [unclassified Rhizobium]|nr:MULTISPECIES: hypothetical protein [unclassified Rhizobium]MBB3397135.1 hypothetical protein [Rhizobium sp. BK060]MBB4168747.1 hypothetical protein [Rhizobium sp. BK538]
MRNLQMAVANLKQDLSFFEERHKRLEVEHEPCRHPRRWRSRA